MEYSIKPKMLGERRIIHYPQKRIIGLYVTNMILTTYDKDLYEKALKEDAREEGLESGILLAKYLFNDNRSKDLERASKDIEYQKKLLKEYGIE